MAHPGKSDDNDPLEARWLGPRRGTPGATERQTARQYGWGHDAGLRGMPDSRDRFLGERSAFGRIQNTSVGS